MPFTSSFIFFLIAQFFKFFFRPLPLFSPHYSDSTNPPFFLIIDLKCKSHEKNGMVDWVISRIVDKREEIFEFNEPPERGLFLNKNGVFEIQPLTLFEHLNRKYIGKFQRTVKIGKFNGPGKEVMSLQNRSLGTWDCQILQCLKK